LIVRSEIAIAAPPRVVWLYLDRLAEWKDSIASVECLEGTPGDKDAVLRIGQRSDDHIVYLIVRTLRVRQHAWTVRALTIEEQPSPHGYLIYSLYEQGPTTLLVNDVLMHYSSDLQLQPGNPALQSMQELTQAKLDTDHLKLKRLIEAVSQGPT